MYYFSRYELLADGDEFSVRLYLDQNRHEFSSDFFGRVHSENKSEDGGLDKAVRRYVKEKLPGVRLRTAYILFGALLIASIPLTEAYARQGPDDPPPVSVSAPAAGVGVQDPAAPDIDTKPQPSVKPTSPPDAAAPPSSDTAVPAVSANTPAAADTASAAVLNKSVLIVANKNHPLPAGFVPKNLVIPDVATKASSSEVEHMRQDAASALEQMFRAASGDGVRLYTVSGYRSYDKQVAVFAASARSHGSEAAANQYSARPGESEHQTGLAMDLTGASSGAGLTDDFGSTPEGQWVKENAWKYGFIIRYPKGKEDVTGYQYEPWHIRYVGTTAAREITERGITLEEYTGID